MQKAAFEPATVASISRPLRAIGLMCLAWALFACLDTTAKYLGTATELPAAQVIWMRFLGQFLAMVAAARSVARSRWNR